MKKIVLIVLLMLVSSPLIAQTLYVQAKQGKLLQESRFKSTVVAVLSRGEAVELLSKKGRWFEVSYGEQQGWMPSLLLAAQPPLDKGQATEYKDHDISDKARRRASSSSSVAATRGLKDDDELGEADDGDSDYEALKEVDKMKVSDDEVQTFKEQGE